MFIIENYSTAVFFCFITMLCWGSWANTQKLTANHWRFELFYWDYVLGILLTAYILAITLGSSGEKGRDFFSDFHQASNANLGSAIIGGIIFNAANILLTAAMAIAGMSVAFPVGIGLALVIGVIVNYIDQPVGNVLLLAIGVVFITLAILLNAKVYRTSSTSTKVSSKGLILSVVSGLLMGLFYKYVANAMFPNFEVPEVGKLSPYTAIFFFSIGILLSNFIFNTVLIYRPFVGESLNYKVYWQGSFKNHVIGFLGGSIWCLGMAFNIIASGKAGPAISYGLGQGATIVAAIWGIYVWKEFKNASKNTNTLLNIMLLFYLIGLGMIISAR
jgi:glucose uptake protein